MGLGSQLMEEILKLLEPATHIKAIYLHVQDGNETALGFYKNYGFDIATRIPDYYTDITPADCLLLRKRLHEEPKAPNSTDDASLAPGA